MIFIQILDYPHTKGKMNPGGKHNNFLMMSLSEQKWYRLIMKTPENIEE